MNVLKTENLKNITVAATVLSRLWTALIFPLSGANL